MKHYTVGKDNSSLLKSRTTWDLLSAINDASDGDTIEIEKDYYYQNDTPIFINKDITLIGKTYQKHNSTCYPEIACNILIGEKSTVTIQGIYFRIHMNANILLISEESSLIIEDLVIENTVEDGMNYPIIHISDNSKIDIKKCIIKPSKIDNHQIFSSNSNISITDSLIETQIFLEKSTFNIIDCKIDYKNTSVLYTEHSKGTIKNCTILGGDSENGHPTIHFHHSTSDIFSTTIEQENFKSHSLWSTSSQLTLTKVLVSSATFEDSTIQIIDDSLFLGNISIESQSHIHGSEITIAGTPNGYINLYADKGSRIQLDTLNIGIISQPSIKIERSVSFKVQHLNKLIYDENQEDFISDDDGNWLKTPLKVDIDFFGEKPALEKLEEMIGLNSIKSDVKEFIALAQMNKLRERKGLSTSTLTLHSLFLGNPGTGKTTVARLMGKLLYEKQLISSDKYVEISRSDIVGQYIGETAQKTRKILESALGGVLFIDEAYTLATGGRNDFGIEAINEILKFMEDHRQDIVIIFAGYSKEMMDFLTMNEGLRSRIPNSFTFEDYTVDQLVQIGLNDLNKQNYIIDATQYFDLIEHNYHLSNDYSNGRWVRNLNERLIRKLALRTFEDSLVDINIITKEDIDEVKIKI